MAFQLTRWHHLYLDLVFLILHSVPPIQPTHSDRTVFMMLLMHLSIHISFHLLVSLTQQPDSLLPLVYLHVLPRSPQIHTISSLSPSTHNRDYMMINGLYSPSRYSQLIDFVLTSACCYICVTDFLFCLANSNSNIQNLSLHITQQRYKHNNEHNDNDNTTKEIYLNCKNIKIN